MKRIKFTEYYDLQKKYKKVFLEIFESYYNKGYFGNVSKEEIQSAQFKWFCKLVETINQGRNHVLEPYVTNHNNKITREYYYKLTGHNIKKKAKKDIIDILKDR